MFRGQVIAFGKRQMFWPGRSHVLRFLHRPRLSRDQVILPPAVLDGVEQQILGVASRASWLHATGQHLKRGVLLDGPPGTGKTHTISYLLGQLPEATVVIVSALALEYVEEACSVARALPPSVVVIEDVDLIAEDRASTLEPALAQRPGRIDHAAGLPIPDAAARRALIALYQGNTRVLLSGQAAGHPGQQR